jgi:hypothetical protein
MTVLDSKPKKSVGHFEENKFSIGCHQFLLECCPKLIKTNNFGQNAVNKRQLKNENELHSAVRLFIFKVAMIFCQSFKLWHLGHNTCPHKSSPKVLL